MTSVRLKKLNVCIGTETNQEIVLIFAEPTLQDVEELINKKSVLKLVNDLLWTKIEKDEEEKNGALNIGLKNWMEVWQKERKKYASSQRPNKFKFQDKSNEKESLDILKVDRDHGDYKTEVEVVKEELDIHMEVKAELSDSNYDVDENEENLEEILRDVPNTKKKFKRQSPGKHKNKTDEDKQKTFLCEICNKTFIDNHRLARHKLFHTGDKQFSCDVCGKAFYLHSNLRDHELIHSGLKPYSCDICKKSFNVKSNLTVHKRKHTGEKPYSCEECGKSFSHSHVLNNHKLIHAGEKPFTCDICGSAFSQNSNLHKHTRRMHTGEKPHSCSFCEKSFVEKSKLTTHLREHTGEKPYSCEICGKAFAVKSVLIRHQSIHSAEKVYSCDICHKSFQLKANLVRHNKSAGHLDRIKSKTNSTEHVSNNFDICDESMKDEELSIQNCL